MNLQAKRPAMDGDALAEHFQARTAFKAPKRSSVASAKGQNLVNDPFWIRKLLMLNVW
jgi:hypothetical protein